jgi:hypothetical protein
LRTCQQSGFHPLERWLAILSHRSRGKNLSIAMIRGKAHA